MILECKALLAAARNHSEITASGLHQSTWRAMLLLIIVEVLLTVKQRCDFVLVCILVGPATLPGNMAYLGGWIVTEVVIAFHWMLEVLARAGFCLLCIITVSYRLLTQSYISWIEDVTQERWMVGRHCDFEAWLVDAFRGHWQSKAKQECDHKLEAEDCQVRKQQAKRDVKEPVGSWKKMLTVLLVAALTAVLYAMAF